MLPGIKIYSYQIRLYGSVFLVEQIYRCNIKSLIKVKRIQITNKCDIINLSKGYVKSLQSSTFDHTVTHLSIRYYETKCCDKGAFSPTNSFLRCLKPNIWGRTSPQVVGKYKWVSLANQVTNSNFCRQENLLPNLKMVGRKFMVPERV